MEELYSLHVRKNVKWLISDAERLEKELLVRGIDYEVTYDYIIREQGDITQIIHNDKEDALDSLSNILILQSSKYRSY